MLTKSTEKYYKILVTMKTGFKYSVFCGASQLKGMKKSSDGYWTESMVVTEATEEDYNNWWWGEDEKPVVATRKKIPKVKEVEEKKPKGRKKSKPEVSGLEEFFESSEEAPENKKLE